MSTNYTNNKRILLSEDNYNIATDNRLLIPFERNGKFGFLNNEGGVAIKDDYDVIYGEFKSPSDLVIVGIMKHRLLGGKIYSKMAYGVIDIYGNLVMDIDYHSILFSNCKEYITVQRYDGCKYALYNSRGENIIPDGTYQWMDGFWDGLARVMINDKWGLINTSGEIVLPIEYDKIWNFYGKTNDTITVQQGRTLHEIPICELLSR